MSAYGVSECGYCGFSISNGQRWVREKIYDPTYKNGGEAEYRRYHAEVFTGDELNCWQKAFNAIGNCPDHSPRC